MIVLHCKLFLFLIFAGLFKFERACIPPGECCSGEVLFKLCWFSRVLYRMLQLEGRREGKPHLSFAFSLSSTALCHIAILLLGDLKNWNGFCGVLVFDLIVQVFFISDKCNKREALMSPCVFYYISGCCEAGPDIITWLGQLNPMFFSPFLYIKHFF